MIGQLSLSPAVESYTGTFAWERMRPASLRRQRDLDGLPLAAELFVELVLGLGVRACQ